MYSMIKRKLQVDVVADSHYVKLMQEARINPKPCRETNEGPRV